ncbi:hypothetical protein [Synechococcus virus S-ESS1]|uniref:VRR-NUC domain-containing protein n=1 Tax=Synechococcus virus S-ESS1 TaxID=1964565 RepID=A0A1V0DX59_9CAUD|nr:endonuclease [Synechococcus virus S-ESS1]ARB05710.1 hypothetical protein [Synechococcus virus S-ESS1]
MRQGYSPSRNHVPQGHAPPPWRGLPYHVLHRQDGLLQVRQGGLMREVGVEMPVVVRAEAAGFFCRKVAWVGRKHAPDRVFAREDRGEVWLEFKKPKGKARLGQIREHDRMRKAGMEVHVVDSVYDGLRILGLLPNSNNGPTLSEIDDLLK